MVHLSSRGLLPVRNRRCRIIDSHHTQTPWGQVFIFRIFRKFDARDNLPPGF